MKEDYIKLHNSDDNSIVIVNKSCIIAVLAFREKNERIASKVYLDTCCSLAPFIVNEAPALIVPENDTCFIMLHDASTNDTITIRKDEISVIDTVSQGGFKSTKSKVYFCGNSDLKPVVVHESAEKIMSTLNDESENSKH